MRSILPNAALLFSCALLFAAPAGVQAKPTVAQALQLQPIQADAEYDRPTVSEAEKCTLEVESIDGKTGWVVRDEDGKLLRRFIDTNSDNKVDRWCYYREGIEVYRDIDDDFNGKADQYRWLGTAGTRWGVDKNENGTIDAWKAISAEELSAEIVAAIRQRDADRFARVLVSASELGTLELGDEQRSQLRDRIEKAQRDFASFVANQKVITKSTQWLHFGATQPGIVPAGTSGSRKDLLVYENVVAVIESDGKHGQLPIGTLVKVGDAWRAIDLPGQAGDQASAGPSGFFFASARAASTPKAGDDEADQWQPWIAKLEEIDQKLLKARSEADLTKLNAGRADVIERLIETLPADQRETWIKQFADTVSAAIQSGQYPEGSARLEKFYKQIEKDVRDEEICGYVKFRWISAEYGRQLRESAGDPDADIAAIQKQWLDSLSAYVADFPRTPDAAEGMLQLAIAEEFAGNESDATRWYQRIVKDFPDDRRAEKARGAITRLDSVGKPITLRGTSTSGQTVDLSRYAGSTVLVHYWATWCEPCKEDLKILAKMQEKYGSKGFRLIGVALDNDKAAVTNYLRSNPVAWPQLHEDGGLDSRLANELGVLTLPTMILVGSDGKVLNRSAHAVTLGEELGEIFK